MAKQGIHMKREGAYGNIIFYRVDEGWYARKKSALDGRRFWKDKAFEGSRRSAGRFAEGNRLASGAYAMIDEDKRVYKLFCSLKKLAIGLLKEGRDGEEVSLALLDYLTDCGLLSKGKKKDIKPIKNKIIAVKPSPPAQVIARRRQDLRQKWKVRDEAVPAFRVLVSFPAQRAAYSKIISNYYF